MTIDGVNTLNYGLVPLNVIGAWDMPNRLTPYAYDWGDEIQPLLLESKMAWSNRLISVEFLYRDTLAAQSLEVLTQSFAESINMPLVLTEATGGIGVYDVNLLSITNHKRYKNNAKIQFNFYEQIPSFSGTLPTPSNSSISLDGFSFSQFGIVINKANDLSGLSEQNDSSVTQYLKSNPKSIYRSLKAIELECTLVGNNRQDALVKMANFQQVLIQPKLLVLQYGGMTFNTFAPLGFQANKTMRRVLKFKLTLFRV